MLDGIMEIDADAGLEAAREGPTGDGLMARRKIESFTYIVSLSSMDC